MTPEEMKNEFHALYNMMANSHDVSFMRTFGNVHKEMMDWMIANKPELAQDWLDKLESIKWNNYLTSKEAEKIMANMMPKAPWAKDVWKQAMTQHSFELSHEPCYNSCALWVTMNMIMSDSSETLKKYVAEEDMFKAVHDLAVDKLKDKDGVFNIRSYFGV